jgi:hypothetical protein
LFSSRNPSTEKAPIAPEDVVRAEKEKKRMDKEQRKVSNPRSCILTFFCFCILAL